MQRYNKPHNCTLLKDIGRGEGAEEKEELMLSLHKVTKMGYM